MMEKLKEKTPNSEFRGRSAKIKFLKRKKMEGKIFRFL